MEYRKRNILITGGTGKIGKVLVTKMVEDGHNVIFTSTTKSKAEALYNNLKNTANFIDYVVLKFGEYKNYINIIEKLPLKIDTIIHNARDTKSLQIENDGFSSTKNLLSEFEVAIVSPYELNRCLINKNHPLRDILFISSMYGVVAPNKNLYDDFHFQSAVQYGVGKSAQLHLVKELGVRFAEKNIRVNAISYGGIQGRVDNEFMERYGKLCPSGRMLNENDLYPPIQFIINNEELNITGENIKIDGGWTIW
jgi:NAD(P)-dependent dehydrogenase (short-subunit alcohol dehydrogenase family)